MKNNKVKFIASIGILILILLLIFPKNVHAEDKDNLNGWINQANNFVTQKGDSPVKMQDVSNTIIPIAQALVAIATVILVVVTIMMGIKYVTCQSAEQKAKLKTQLIGLGIATVVIFGAQLIWSTLYNVMTGITK